MTLAEVPTPHAIPYGIVILSSNAPFFCEFGSNKLATIDPKTMTVHEYTLPNPEARPRRIALAPDGTVFYTDFARGYLGHFDPAAGKAPQRVALARRLRLRALRHRHRQRRHRLVQRIRSQAQHARPLRSQVPNLQPGKDPLRRRRGPEHGRHPRWEALPRLQRSQQSRRREFEVALVWGGPFRSSLACGRFRGYPPPPRSCGIIGLRGREDQDL